MTVTYKRHYVTHADVFVYAKAGCSSCYVPGLHQYVTRDRNGNETRRQEVCPRAWERFCRKNPTVQHDAESNRYYLEIPEETENGKEPHDQVA